MPNPRMLDEDVSRETMFDLEKFVDLVIKWNKSINLVSRQSGDVIWDRHIRDSLQLASTGLTWNKWVDLGSGGGFPAIPLAIIEKSNGLNRPIHLIESDKRKSAFLMTVIRDLNLNASVHVSRAESVDPMHADVLSARALASLDTLLEYTELHLNRGGHTVFLKGQNWQEEVSHARENWTFDLDAMTSKTDVNSRVLLIKNMMRRVK